MFVKLLAIAVSASAGNPLLDAPRREWHIGAMIRSCLCAALVALPVPALATEAFLGVAAQSVETPFTIATGQRGTSLQAGVRGRPIGGLRAVGSPQPYLFGAVNTGGGVSFAAAGLSWRIGKGPVFLRPGIGLAIHDGRIPTYDAVGRSDLGSRVLFEPELALGVRISPRVAVEASWVHLSHAQLFGGQNPGVDIIGARLSFEL